LLNGPAMLALALAALLAPPTQVAVLTREAALQRFRERGFDRVLADVQVEAARADAARLDAAINEQASAETYARYRRLRRVGVQV